jgi:hypothetical protein
MMFGVICPGDENQVRHSRFDFLKQRCLTASDLGLWMNTR